MVTDTSLLAALKFFHQHFCKHGSSPVFADIADLNAAYNEHTETLKAFEGQVVPKEKPVFVHDCQHCTFLGHYYSNLYNGQFGSIADLYHCVQGGRLPTVIARFGNEGDQYLSGLNSDLPALKEAQNRAKAQGLSVEYKF